MENGRYGDGYFKVDTNPLVSQLPGKIYYFVKTNYYSTTAMLMDAITISKEIETTNKVRAEKPSYC